MHHPASGPAANLASVPGVLHPCSAGAPILLCHSLASMPWVTHPSAGSLRRPILLCHSLATMPWVTHLTSLVLRPHLALPSTGIRARGVVPMLCGCMPSDRYRHRIDIVITCIYDRHHRDQLLSCSSWPTHFHPMPYSYQSSTLAARPSRPQLRRWGYSGRCSSAFRPLRVLAPQRLALSPGRCMPYLDRSCPA